MRVFQAAMTQAEELWGAASAVGAASRPLPLFYCLSQAGRAICAAWLRDEDWRPTIHGISSRVVDQGSDVPTYGVKVAGESGMYSRVSAATDSPTFTGTARIAELWASLPDLPQPRGFEVSSPRPLYVEEVRVGSEPESPMEIFARLLVPKHGRIAHPRPQPVADALEQLGKDESRLSLVSDALRDYPSAQGVVPELHTVHTVLGEERVVVLTFPDEAGELRPLSEVGDPSPLRTGLREGTPSRFIIRPRIGSGDEPPPSQFMTLWALVYAFSQLARYEPEVWVAALNPDESPIAVDLEHALDAALELVPELLVPAVTSGLMPRLMREHMEEAQEAARDPEEPPEAGSVTEHNSG